MSAVCLGKITWGLQIDKDQQRSYSLTTRVVTSSPTVGPFEVAGASGLPVIGSLWNFGSDYDAWAYCRPEMTIRPVHIRGEPHIYWDVDQTFSTIPFKRCNSSQPGNPLSEPQKVSGSFTKLMKKADKDRNGKLIKNSSLEVIKLDKEESYPRVNIEQNVGSLGLVNLCQMINKLNDSTLWGLPKRCVRLSQVSWTRNVYGSCSFYYTRRFEFDINFDTFDRDDIADVGRMRLRGKYDPDTGVWSTEAGLDATKPDSYIRIKDIHGEIMPPQPLKDGKVNTDPINDPQFLDAVELYGETNLLSLGIPTSF